VGQPQRAAQQGRSARSVQHGTWAPAARSGSTMRRTRRQRQQQHLSRRRAVQGRDGKVVQVYRKRWVIHIERLTREKVNGTLRGTLCCCVRLCSTNAAPRVVSADAGLLRNTIAPAWLQVRLHERASARRKASARCTACSRRHVKLGLQREHHLHARDCSWPICVLSCCGCNKRQIRCDAPCGVQARRCRSESTRPSAWSRSSSSTRTGARCWRARRPAARAASRGRRSTRWRTSTDAGAVLLLRSRLAAVTRLLGQARVWLVRTITATGRPCAQYAVLLLATGSIQVLAVRTVETAVASLYRRDAVLRRAADK
jgi:hypothetical protein